MDSAFWIEERWLETDCWPGTEYLPHFICLQGKDTIDGKIYGKFVNEDYRVRVDSHKVYYRTPSTPEVLAYNFNQQVGDTFTFYNDIVDTTHFKVLAEVVSLDTFTLPDGFLQRRLIYESIGGCIEYRSFSVVDGVGSSIGVLQLECHTIDAGLTTKSLTRNTAHCGYPTSISTIDNSCELNKISSNTFELNCIEESIKKASLINILGEVISVKQNGNTIEIPATNEGVYIMQIQLESGKHFTQKLYLSN